MKKIIEKKASIIQEYNGIKYNVSTLIENCSSDGFSYVFIPNYDVISLLPKNVFDEIQGLDLSLKKESYFREGIPTFIYERVPPENRVNIQEILKQLGLEYYDPLDILLASKSRYSGDSLIVVPFINKEVVEYNSLINNQSFSSVKSVMQSVANGNEILINGIKIQSKDVFSILEPIYHLLLKKKRDDQLKGVTSRKNNNSYNGRPKIQMNKNDLEQIIMLYKTKSISIDQVTSLLGISRSTFLRRVKECQK